MENVELDFEDGFIDVSKNQIGRILTSLGILLCGIYILVLFFSELLFLISHAIGGSFYNLDLFRIIGYISGIIGGIFFIIGIFFLLKNFQPFIGENLRKILLFFLIFITLYYFIGFSLIYLTPMSPFIAKIKIAIDSIGIVMLIPAMYQLKNAFKKLEKATLVFKTKLLFYYVNIAAVGFYIISNIISLFTDYQYSNQAFLYTHIVLYILGYMLLFIGITEFGLKFLTFNKDLLKLLISQNTKEKKMENNL